MPSPAQTQRARIITMHVQDLEYLIEKSVSIDRADFAVVAGVQIHNWAALVPEQPQPGQQQQAALPCLEFVAPTKVRLLMLLGLAEHSHAAADALHTHLPYSSH